MGVVKLKFSKIRSALNRLEIRRRTKVDSRKFRTYFVNKKKKQSMLRVYKNIFYSGPPIKIEYYEKEREEGVQVKFVLTE